jgi:demethylmenaquinone methyltransferase/2-methoxy-6-polyprenyl-1,4-benzoquinol methylase
MQKNDIYHPEFVKGVFDRCSGQYIFFSYICSFGFTERWRKQCVVAIQKIYPDDPTGYDLMAGTGEAWPHLLKQFPHIHSITAVDISSGMHERALERLHAHRSHKIQFIEDDVLASDLPENSADFVIATFGLKTFQARQHRKLAYLVAKILKPGGRFSFVEASNPSTWILAAPYGFYMKTILPLVEKFFLKGAQDFSMIGTYTDNFGDCTEFTKYLQEAGLEAEFRSYFFGCATGVSGYKPLA